MMRARLLIGSIACFAVSVAFAAPAQAVGVAGWDFSQYFGATILSTDGATFTNTLDANYSNLDPTFNAGAESAAFGTMYMDGSFGSTNVNAGSGTEEFSPTTGSLVSNIGFAPAAINPFDSFPILVNEGQAFTELLSMATTAAVSVVFAADLSSVPDLGQAWTLSLGGQTFSGSQSVGVEFSTDGSSYVNVGSLNLTTIDTPFTLNLGAGPSDLAFVRLSFAETGAIIDNVTLSANLVPIPEPATATLLLLGLAGLARAGRRSA
jgi:hypothetical protein